MKSKIWLFTLCLVVASLLAATPVIASNGDECPNHEATILSLRACVAHAAEIGHIDNRGVVKSLLAKLDAAQRALDRGQSRVAVANVEAFIHAVEAQAGKHIDAQHASHMIMHANQVIDAL
jgi:hypothetical protein